MAVAIFVVSHWVAAVFFQSFFLHRHGAHRMFTMSKPWERLFHLGTFVAMGASYLDPRGYAIIHRLHHAYSDTVRDPHSPHHHPNVWAMMWHTRDEYCRYAHRGEQPEARFDGDIPSWPWLDRIGQRWATRIAWLGVYTTFYMVFATSWWQLVFLPTHMVMGPIHGAIVNWCGHRYGYRNFATADRSRNTLLWDLLMGGELFQNNHHRHPNRANFAARTFEIDPIYPVMRLLSWIGVISWRASADGAAVRSDNAQRAA